MSEISKAETFIREQTALYRHYRIDEVQLQVEQFTGESLSDEQAVSMVQGIRDEYDMGPIDEFNLPGQEDEEEHRPWWNKFW